ncbi:MAG: hypothetical protein JWO94_3282 [Verrucomicrobiaceae bacterium]|nr:hypothetical protein [Verrucomicrobiaceae bacterium]
MIDVSMLMDQPTLPEMVEVLTLRLAEERQRRLKFYEEITPDMKAEFINGEVIMHSPALARHTEARMRVTHLMYSYVGSRKLGRVHDEKSLCTFPRNDYEPDVVFFGPEKAAAILPSTLQFPPPDFACEVLSLSTEKRDRGVKFQDYEAHGVREYWIVDPEAEILEQYVLDANGRYELRMKSSTGQVVSAVVPGFSIPVRAIFDEATHWATVPLLNI